jgi:hypothetical protein
MTTRHTLTSLALAALVAAFAIPTAGATPDGYVVRTIGSALDAKSAIESRADTSRVQDRVPDGYQPQLAMSDGAVSAPDNLVRHLPRGTFPIVAEQPRATDRGFDWNDGMVGFLAALLVATLAAGFGLAARGRTLARA